MMFLSYKIFFSLGKINSIVNKFKDLYLKNYHKIQQKRKKIIYSKFFLIVLFKVSWISCKKLLLWSGSKMRFFWSPYIKIAGHKMGWGHSGLKSMHSFHRQNIFPMSLGMSCEWVQRSVRANEWMNGASEWTSGWANGPALNASIP